MSQNQINYPDNLYSYYQDNPNFEEKTNTTKKIIYGVLFLASLLVAIYPHIIGMTGILIRIIGGIGAVVFGLTAFLGGKDYYNKVSGGKIEDIAIKKFDSESISEDTLTQMFVNNDFKGLSDAYELNNQPLQLYVHEDKTGKVFYLQLMKYFSSSDFRGISEVKIITEPEYSSVYKVIKSIKSTN